LERMKEHWGMARRGENTLGSGRSWSRTSKAYPAAGRSWGTDGRTHMGLSTEEIRCVAAFC
jgi:hypothetical protein